MMAAVCRLGFSRPWVPALKGSILLQSRSDLLAALSRPRPGAAKSEKQHINARHLFVCARHSGRIPGHVERQAGRH